MEATNKEESLLLHIISYAFFEHYLFSKYIADTKLQALRAV